MAAAFGAMALPDLLVAAEGDITAPEVEVVGTYETGVGTSDAASEGTVTARRIETRPALRPAPFPTAAAHSKKGVASPANARKARSCHGQLRRSSKCVSALKSTATSRPSFDGRIPAPGLGICVS